MVKTLRAHDFWIWHNQIRSGCNRKTRYVVSQSLCLLGTYYFATACIRMGGTCVFESWNFLSAISTYDVTDITLLPTLLAQVLDNLPENFKKPEKLSVYTFGGSVSKALRARALDSFATEIVESYGANEVGSICTVAANGVGSVLPGMRVQVVDDEDRPVTGQPGHVRVESGGSIEFYPDDKEATARMFRNGWFYPGDIGVMVGGRSLKLIGRADELINIGGQKINPEILEERISRLVSVNDLCFTAVEQVGEARQLWAALVLKPPSRLEDIQESVVQNLPKSWGEIGFIELKEIPRTSTGKVQRNKVAALIQDRQKGL